MNNLKFRRQFLLSPQKCEDLKDWQSQVYGKYHLYVHPDCELTVADSPSMHLALAGYIIDPADTNKLNQDILQDIAQSNTISDVYKKLYNYGGRFVLIVKQSEEYYIFHDACGLRSVFYTKYANEIYVASQPLLFKFFMPLNEGGKYHSYYNSEFIKSDKEHFLPSGISLYDDVYHLVPNHYLKFSTLSQVRFWPDKEYASSQFDDSLKQATSLLTKLLKAADHRFKLALPLTAGLDSRSVMSACKHIAENLFFYTLQYRELTPDSNDIRIPHEVLAKVGYHHHIIDCRKPIPEDFSDIYVQNTDIPHLYDWGSITHGMMEEYPSERVAIKGSCAEIGRCAYYKTGKHKNISSVEVLFSTVIDYRFKWKDIPFIKKQVSDWFSKIEDSKANMGYDLLDLFYWEHRIGSWQSQSQLEFDIIQEEFTPFNNRALLDIILAVDPRYRSKPDYIFYRSVIQNLWKEILSVPINPKVRKEKIKEKVKDVLKQTGLFWSVKRVMKK